MTLRRSFILMLLIVAAACSNKPDKPKPVAEVKAGTRLTLLAEDTIRVGKPVTVLAKLNNIKERTVITEDQLQTVHTQKFHLLVVDSTLTDYQHIHPQQTSTPGVYKFTFTPKLAGGYRAWADITPVGGKQQFVMSEELGAHRIGAVSKTESHDASVGSYHFSLSFDKPPVANGESMGTITVTKNSQPVGSLEPVMGAFAHIVGFYDDFRTVVHTHPMGKEPAKEQERGGPDLTFHLSPSKPGFIKLFAQMRIDGKEMFVPFGIVAGKAQEQR
jgi:hypothetical protein